VTGRWRHRGAGSGADLGGATSSAGDQVGDGVAGAEVIAWAVGDQGRLLEHGGQQAAVLANLTVPTLAEVIAQAHRGIQRVRQIPYLAYSFLRHAGLSVA
jgi:hypothetical protein